MGKRGKLVSAPRGDGRGFRKACVLAFFSVVASYSNLSTFLFRAQRYAKFADYRQEKGINHNLFAYLCPPDSNEHYKNSIPIISA